MADFEQNKPMTFSEKLVKIHEESKEMLEEMKIASEKTNREQAEKFMEEFIFPKIQLWYERNTWYQVFSFKVGFCNQAWQLLTSDGNSLGYTFDYSKEIEKYITEVAKENGIRCNYDAFTCDKYGNRWVILIFDLSPHIK